MIVVRPPTEDRDVWFRLCGTGETMCLPQEDFRARYQLVVADQPALSQVPPEVPPLTHDEWLRRRLEGW